MSRLLGLLFLMMSGCALVAHPRPTPPKVLEVEGSVGGPIAQQKGSVFPLPLLSGGVRYGVSDRLDVHGHLHLGAIIERALGADLGTTVLLLDQRGLRPAVSTTARALAFTDFNRGFRPFGELGLHMSWVHHERWLTYATGSAVFDVGGRDDGVWSIGAGQAVRFGALSLNLEVRAYEPSFVDESVLVRFPQLFGYAPFGVVFGVQYAFGGSTP